MQPGARARDDRCMKRRQEYPCRRFMSFLWGWGVVGVGGARLLFRPCGSGLFGPNADGRALHVHAEFGGFGEYAPRQCGFLRIGSIAEIGFRRTDVLGVDEREFARFGDAECRIGKFVPLCGGEAVVRFGLCRHGCCSIGVVAGIRKFPASHRFFAQRLLRCPMCFAR